MSKRAVQRKQLSSGPWRQPHFVIFLGVQSFGPQVLGACRGILPIKSFGDKLLYCLSEVAMGRYGWQPDLEGDACLRSGMRLSPPTPAGAPGEGGHSTSLTQPLRPVGQGRHQSWPVLVSQGSTSLFSTGELRWGGGGVGKKFVFNYLTGVGQTLLLGCFFLFFSPLPSFLSPSSPPPFFSEQEEKAKSGELVWGGGRALEHQ